MASPAKHVAFDKAALRRSLQRDERARNSAKLRQLREQVKGTRAARTKALRDATTWCREERLRARARARAIQEEAKQAAKEERAAARSSCAVNIEDARAIRDDIERARVELETEKKWQADMRRIEGANRRRSTERKPRTSARERRDESDDEVRANIPEELIPLFERVKRGIKGNARMSRTEAFLHYAEENPKEVLDAEDIEDQTDALIAELERQQRSGRRNPGKLVALGLLTRIDWRGGHRSWSLKKAPTLVYDGAGRLFVVYAARAVGTASAADVREYARTHWGQRGNGRESEGELVKPPFRKLGEGISITYTTRKGTSELVDWVHEWGEGARGQWIAPVVLEHVCRGSACAAKGQIALAGGTYRVTERGIVG